MESLDLTTLLAYVEELSTTPIARGVWRGDQASLAAAAANAVPGQTRSRNTINSYMRPLRSLCTYLMSEGVLTSDPFIRAKRRGGGNPLLPSEETPAKGATLNDLECLRRGATGKDATDLRDRAIIELIITTGARAGSICKVRMEDLDLERGRVRFARAKGGKTYEAILQPEARAALLRYLNRGRSRLLRAYPVRGYTELRVGADPGWLFLSRENGNRKTPGGRGRFTVSGLSQMITERYHEGGGTLGYFGAHRIRHGVATILANNGVALDELAGFLAHSSTVPTKRYANQSPEAIGDVASAAMARAGVLGPRSRRAS